TYAVFIARTQGSGAYTGKVKYTIVHPADNTPVLDAYLESGESIAAKIDGMASRVPNNSYCSSTCFCEGNALIHSSVEAIKRSDVLPGGFTPSNDNTISLASSPTKVYMWFDDTNNTIYYYANTRGKIYMDEYPGFTYYHSPNDAYILMPYLSDISGLSDWDASRVVGLGEMFSWTSITDFTPISDWDVSNVVSMDSTFRYSNISDLAPLANWDVSNVTDMHGLFATSPAYDECTDTTRASTFTDLTPLANWDVSNVTRMSGMFYGIATLVNSEPIKNWDVRGVNNFVDMFGGSTPRTNLPIFTSRPGTWDNNGTYTPNP
ncbi:BspA family leucine-rich repeat surface protein, partial [Candidatus Saccharibacteria bacterium]|nr:BspA family leucine-rich repeat surface protein [Candidatus Saccharibacteria bacterium]